MESFTLKDDDGNSIYYSDEEYESSKKSKDKDKKDSPSAKPSVARQRSSQLGLESNDLGSSQSFSESVSSKDFASSSGKPSKKEQDSSTSFSKELSPEGQAPGRTLTGTGHLDLAQRGRNKTRMTSTVMRRVTKNRYVDLGVPGAYDRFNFEDAYLRV